MKIARLASRAQRRGMSVDEYVQHPQATDDVPHDRLVRLFLGETQRPPSDERLRRAVAWMLWARGRRAVSLAHLAEALRLDPENLLAGGLRLHFLQHTPAWLTAEPLRGHDV